MMRIPDRLFSHLARLEMFMAFGLAAAAGWCGAAEPEPSPAVLLQQSRRVVFLGDSITAAGGYVAGFEAWLLTRTEQPPPLVIDAGLPSETVSGLSEEGHAGGRFPRPDLAERLDRVLQATRPNLVVACYGINCGIYEPFDAARFARYQAGIQNLRERVARAGSRLVHITPPFYDDARAKKPFSYNAVLDRYSDWLLAQREMGWNVIDLHGPMTRYVTQRRLSEPEFTVQPDAVHPNAAGHWFIAQQVIRGFGDEQAAGAESPEQLLRSRHISPEAWPLLQRRVAILRDAYVSAAGHLRPGVAAGLQIPEAEQKAAELTRHIERLRGVVQRDNGRSQPLVRSPELRDILR
jgi:lysophospholipase L1-like esterase